MRGRGRAAIPKRLSEVSLEIMSLPRRVVALLTGLLLLQFILVGSGFACAVDRIDSGSTMTAMDDMASMGMGATDPPQTQANDALGDSEAAPEQPCGAPAGGEDCGGPNSSGACTAMTTCAPPALGVDRTAFAQPAPSRQDASRARVIPPRSRGTAPDYPPPRA